VFLMVPIWVIPVAVVLARSFSGRDSKRAVSSLPILGALERLCAKPDGMRVAEGCCRGSGVAAGLWDVK